MGLKHWIHTTGCEWGLCDSVICMWKTGLVYLLYMIPWVFLSEATAASILWSYLVGLERQGQPTQHPPAPPFSIIVPQPRPPGGNMPDCGAATDSMCPWIYDGDLLAAFHVKSHLEFRTVAVCVVSDNPLTFTADTYGGWLSASHEPWLSLTLGWPQHFPPSAPWR